MSSSSPVYFDYQATTPCDPEVVKAMLPWFNERFGNPSSRIYTYGMEAHSVTEISRKTIAEWIGALPEEIYFTSGATEANNIALVGSVSASGPKRRHIVISSIEHEAVYDPAHWLRDECGCSLSVVPPGPDGIVCPGDIEKAIRPDTLLVSVMHVNNVIGTINDIKTIGSICRKQGVFFHVDAAQSIGKIPFDVKEMNVDMASMSAHKIYGPKGMGFLYASRKPVRAHLKPLTRGGGQENGIRPGTLAVPLIAGMGTAAKIAAGSMEEESARLLRQRKRLMDIVNANLDGVVVNGTIEDGRRIPGNLNISFRGVGGEALLVALRSIIAVSAGSACASGGGPSRVLLALGLDHKLAAAGLRIGIGRYTTDEDIELAGDSIVEKVRRIRKNSSY